MKLPTRRILALVIAPLLVVGCAETASPSWTYAPGASPAAPSASAGTGTASPPAASDGASEASAAPGSPTDGSPAAERSPAEGTGSPVPAGATEGLTLEISTPEDQPLSFSESELTAPAESEVTVVYLNESELPHNVAFFEGTDATAPRIAATEVEAGPGNRQEVTFTTPQAGSYYFHCDVHPVEMKGTFEVTD